MTTPVPGAGVQPAKTDPQKPTSGVTIKQGLEKTQLASVFNAAIMSATNAKSRNISIWNSNNDGDSKNVIDEAEMRAAIEAIQKENKKTESDKEEVKCREFCKKYDIEFYSEKLSSNVPQNETAARTARYEFYKRAAKKFNTKIKTR